VIVRIVVAWPLNSIRRKTRCFPAILSSVARPATPSLTCKVGWDHCHRWSQARNSMES